MATLPITALRDLRDEMGSTFAKVDLVTESATSPQVSTETWQKMLGEMILDLTQLAALCMAFVAPFLPDEEGAEDEEEIEP